MVVVVLLLLARSGKLLFAMNRSCHSPDRSPKLYCTLVLFITEIKNIYKQLQTFQGFKRLKRSVPLVPKLPVRKRVGWFLHASLFVVDARCRKPMGLFTYDVNTEGLDTMDNLAKASAQKGALPPMRLQVKGGGGGGGGGKR